MKSTKSPRSAPGEAAVNVVSDLGRQQVVVATESACALFRGFEAMRKIQEDAAQAASQRHAVAAKRLREGTGPAQVMAVQSELLQSDLQAAAAYWQALATAALETQNEIVGCGTHLLDSAALLEGTSALGHMQLGLPGLDAFFPARKSGTSAFSPV